MAKKQVRLIFGATYFSESVNTDLFWMAKISLPDAHVFLEIEFEDGRWERILLASPLEFTRAKKQAQNCLVVSIQPHVEKLRQQKIPPSMAAIVKEFLSGHGLDTVTVHPLTPIDFVESLRREGVGIVVGKRPWYEERLIKTSREIENILEVQGHMETVLSMVRERLGRAKVLEGIVVEDGKPLTSEELRSFIELELYKRGCVSLDTIVSSGADAAIPHEVGSGPLRANTGIVFDIFPYSRKTGYFSDMTRTFCKGEPPPQFVQMYKAVLQVQEMCLRMVRHGANGKDIQEVAEHAFVERGFMTDRAKGHGFIHGVGHGLGLLCHEPPAGISSNYHYIFTQGVVTSVEPGLYYPEDGLGVRIEDLVLVQENGCQNLTSLPKDLDWVIID